MTWTPLPLGPAVDVVASTTKKRVTLTLGPAAARRLGWSEDEPNVNAALGDGEHAGWLRITLDEDGTTAEPDQDGRLVLTLPRSALPDLADCRASPLTCRLLDGAVEVRLPTVAGSRRPAARVAVDNTRATDEPTLDVISVPALYQNLHSTAWQNGVELVFLSDGNVSVNGKISSIDEVETIVQTAIDRRTASRQRAG